MKKVLFALLIPFLLLGGNLKNLSANDVEQMASQGVPLFDIRTPLEWTETGIIEGSHKLTFFDERGGYDMEAFMTEFKKHVKSTDDKFVLVCRTGSRTGMVGRFLVDKLGYSNAAHLQGGIFAWMRSGKATNKK